MTTHPEDQGPISPERRVQSTASAEPPWLLLRHAKPVSLTEHLHQSLDRLLAEMMRTQEPQGVLAITILDATGPWAGRTVMLAVDLDPMSHEHGPECEPGADA